MYIKLVHIQLVKSFLENTMENCKVHTMQIKLKKNLIQKYILSILKHIIYLHLDKQYKILFFQNVHLHKYYHLLKENLVYINTCFDYYSWVKIFEELETYKLKTYMIVKKQPSGKWLIVEEMMQTKQQIFLKYADKK